MFDHLILAFLFVIYALLFAQFVRVRASILGAKFILMAFIIWPFILTDEWLKVTNNVSAISVFSGFTTFIPVLCMTLLYSAIKQMTIDNPLPSNKLLWLPLSLSVVMQIPVALAGRAEKTAWLHISPIGSPLDYWSVYAVSLVTGFCVLILGILTTEMVQNYHRHLPDQVADVDRYQIRWVVASLGISSAIAGCCILLVTGSAFGFIALPEWQTVFHILLASGVLLVLIAMSRPQRTSPSPLDYYRLDELKADHSSMRNALYQAEREMDVGQSGVITGLRLKDFAKRCHVEPTTLIIALKLLYKQNFSDFVQTYRE